MAAQTEYRGARRADTDDTPAVDGRYRLFDEYVSLSDELEGEQCRYDELGDRLHHLRARREELRNELLDFLGAAPVSASKGLPF